MESSDSECFESADEDFISDNDEQSRKVAKSPSPVRAKIETLGIADDKQPVAGEKSRERSVSASSEDKEKKNKSSRLCVKLGTKVPPPLDATKRGFPESVRVKRQKDEPVVASKDEEENMWENEDWETLTSNVVKPEVKREVVPPQEEEDTWKKEDWETLASNVKVEVKRETVHPQEEDMWENDEWEPFEQPSASETQTQTSKGENVDRNKADQFNSNWSSWGNWGSSLLSTATVGVSTITNHVSQGLSTVLESGIGAPDPEELARSHAEAKSAEEEKPPTEALGFGSFLSSVTHITKLVETTGNKVITSGLDTLETIGKKTMEVLQEGDPGLKKKRAFLKIDGDKVVLSQVLREAKEKAEADRKLAEERHFNRKVNYETLFDDHQGLVHLEALEMLSRQCDIKLQTLLESQFGDDLLEMQETMAQIKELCELPEDEEEETATTSEIKEKLTAASSELNVPVSYEKLISSWEESEQWLEGLNLSVCSELELHEQSINILAQLTAVAVELFHKAGELLLIKERRSTVDEADSLVQITATVNTLIDRMAKKITDKLNEKGSHHSCKNNVNELITNVYYEATNSGSYVKNAFQLLIPVLQAGAV